MRNAILSGVGDTRVGRLEGSSVLGLHADAAFAALEDAGLRLDEVDGLICAYALAESYPMLASVFAESVGLTPQFSTSIQSGGASGCTMAMVAAALVETGRCRHVLCVAGDCRLSGMPKGAAVQALAAFGHPQFEQPYGISIPAAYALVARRYMHDYGATMEELAAIAVAHREHAGRHPKAHLREPITLDDVAQSRIIASPLRLLDCCPVSDGGAAFVVSAAECAGDLAKPGVRLLGSGQKHTHEHILAAPSLTAFGCKDSAAQAFGRAGVRPDEIDVAEVYDSFTITLLIELESVGFFEKGEAGKAAHAGALGLGGRLPCNTHGGLLSFGHSGAAGGMFHVVEAVRQLRGEAEARQVADARLAFVHGDGGVLSAHCSLVLGRA
jgi:acetyl-CoA acetyltransferase